MDSALRSIDHDELTTGMTGVYYRWSKRWEDQVTGPFKVKLRSRGHEGEWVDLQSDKLGDRRVLLADDEDYGHPTFYVLA